LIPLIYCSEVINLKTIIKNQSKNFLNIWKNPINKSINSEKVSIVIPTYNHGEYIEKCIKSIVNQTYKNWEAIIVNNNSSDNTIEKINDFDDDRIKIINIDNYGIIAKSRNVGINSSVGSHIAFLDSDDWWYPNKLEVVMGRKRDADFIYHYLDIYKNGEKTRKKHRIRQLSKPVFDDLMINANAIANSASIVKKEILLEVGGLSEDKEIKAVEDYDLWLRIARVTESFLLIPEYLGGYLISGDNSSIITYDMVNKIDAVFNKNVVYLNDALKKQAYYTKEYTKGRYLFNLNEYTQALSCFKSSKLSNNIEFKIKSYLMIVLTKLKRFIGVK